MPPAAGEHTTLCFAMQDIARPRSQSPQSPSNWTPATVKAAKSGLG